MRLGLFPANTGLKIALMRPWNSDMNKQLRTLALIAIAMLIVGGYVVARFHGPDASAQADSSVAGMTWSGDLSAALDRARGSGKPVMVDFYATWCPPCKLMDKNTWTDSAVQNKLRAFEIVRIDVDLQPRVMEKYGIQGMPTVICLDPKGKELQRSLGYTGPEEMVKLLGQWLDSHPKTTTNIS